MGDARFERAGKYYFWYIRFNWLWSLNLFALVLLNFLEVSLSFSLCVCVSVVWVITSFPAYTGPVTIMEFNGNSLEFLAWCWLVPSYPDRYEPR